MGYSSTAVIAVHKKVLAEDLVSPILPEILKNTDVFTKVYDTSNARYWVVGGWKWHRHFPEIKAIEEFFSLLEERCPIQEERSYGVVETVCFGALRLGEDKDDVETWGDPTEYDIYETCRIAHPNEA